jgi:nitrate/TMAO reductase-like tetraheme cytochrome c subunit
MSAEHTPSPPGWVATFRNWISIAGGLIIFAGVFCFLLLFALDVLAHFSNPYLGILTYMITPAVGAGGILLVLLGAWIERRRQPTVKFASSLRIDFTSHRDRKILGIFIVCGLVFLLLSAVGSYQTYHFTESVQFCGETCHTVMQPENVAYHNGSHARVACVECHIGSGATWFVKSKMSGSYQVYAVLAHKYSRPIPTPVKSLRPAQDTCEQCHWPGKFLGNLDRTFNYFLDDATNTPYSVRLLLKVGGADPTHGPVGGIHWHMSVANKIEYYASDETRQKIPYVRLTDAQGVVTEFRAGKFTNTVSQADIRRMDCIDCHNRPAHQFATPVDAVNLAIELGKINRGLPWIKTNAVWALAQPYTNTDQALSAIATILAGHYPGDSRIAGAIGAVQDIYTNNFFPAMNTDWRSHPSNLGHQDWPGCFRCHDGDHKTADGKRIIKASDCTTCHIILAQGTGAALLDLSATGKKFVHPGDEIPDGYLCSDCHNGGP